MGRDRSLGFMSCALDRDALAAVVVGRGHGVTPDVSWLVQGVWDRKAPAGLRSSTLAPWFSAAHESQLWCFLSVAR